MFYATNDLPPTIEIEGKTYDVSKVSEQALAQLRGMLFCDGQIQQLNNEWAVADTARLGYLHAIKAEFKSHNGS